MTTLATILKIALAALLIGLIAAWVWVPLLRDMPEPLPDRLKSPRGYFSSPDCTNELETNVKKSVVFVTTKSPNEIIYICYGEPRR